MLQEKKEKKKQFIIFWLFPDVWDQRWSMCVSKRWKGIAIMGGGGGGGGWFMKFELRRQQSEGVGGFVDAEPIVN